jgi:hypothetical protein
MNPPKADVVKQFHQATRMGWMASKRFLMTENPELCERILEAGKKQSGADKLHDPIEDHPDYRELIATLKVTIEKEVREEMAREIEKQRAAGGDTHLREWPLGTCHLMWRRMKDRLAAKGVTWYSPAELNPGCIFD